MADLFGDGSFLKLTGGIIFWTLITFGLLVLIIGKYAWKPIINALDARRERIKEDIKNAKDNKDQAQKILEEQKKLLEESRKEAENIIVNARSEAIIVKKEELDKVNLQAKDIIDKAKKEVETAKNKALDELKKEIAIISLDIASKIINKSLSYKDHEELINRSLDQYQNLN